MRRKPTGRPSPLNPLPPEPGEWNFPPTTGWWSYNRRDFLIAALLAAGIFILAAAVVLWRPAKAENDPYKALRARWTVGELDGNRAFVGLGVFTFRPNWDGPEQVFPGPTLFHVVESSAPVRARFSGAVTIGKAGAERAVEQAAAASGEVVLSRGDVVALPTGVGFGITTGEEETVRLMAVAILPNGPPSTPGIEQTEWRTWGVVSPAPETPLVVSVYDLELAGGETYHVSRDRGPALLSVEGSSDGAQSIGLTLTKGRGTYYRIADTPPFDLEGPITYNAVQTPTTSRERVFDARSGAYLPPGSAATIRNRSLVDGTGVIMVTFDGPNIVAPTPTPTPTSTPAASPTTLGTRPPV